jgi:hypothetical protein
VTPGRVTVRARFEVVPRRNGEEVMSDANEVFRPGDGDVVVWVAEGQGSIMLKAVTSYGDPAELNAEEVRELIGVLTRLLPVIDD